MPNPNAISADAALRRLMEGNARYVANKPAHRDFSAGRAERTKSQYPIAAVLGCADSRVAPEFAFDQGPGDLYVVRLAGNFANDDGVASLEYAVKFLGVPLVMVLGHSNCGAIGAAIKVVERSRVAGTFARSRSVAQTRGRSRESEFATRSSRGRNRGKRCA